MTEVEEVLKGKPFAFVTEDFRVYDHMMLSDDAVFYDLDAAEIHAIMELRNTIENVTDGMHEMAFTDIVKNAQELEASFNKVLEMLKLKKA